ncbi:tautomerase family protein [Actinacidiphila epipremni]|uniref:4-oxalocrotonate tautomerase-like domain-containing protein n=1 Tax=Actinacidiphila epipremni TaxID=2053013 RepID=A0ABX0ZP16_9ACTN|nr:tautomerase family protein [Actinacidiphila epipremni]NJP43559.1 hypothetical protein [Actinacidiphila epipremni]
MPLVQIQLLEGRIAPGVESRLIEECTRAVARVLGEEVRESTWVVVQPVPAHRWGVGGRPCGAPAAAPGAPPAEHA